MFSIQFTFSTEVFNAFRCLQIGGMRAGLLHQPLQYLRIFQHGTGPQMIFIKGLVVVICHEQRLLQAVQKANIADYYSGFVKLIFGKNGTLIGGTVMAPNAGLVAQELAYAVKYEMNASEIAAVPHLTNDWSELIRTAAERLK